MSQVVRWSVLPVLVLLPLVGCTKAEPVGSTVADVCNEARFDGKRVRLEGYLFLNDATVCGGGSCTLSLADGPKNISVRMPVGEGPSTMDALGESYSTETIKIRSSDGKPLGQLVETKKKSGKPMIGVNDHVRLLGDMWIMGDKVCQLKVDDVQKI